MLNATVAKQIKDFRQKKGLSAKELEIKMGKAGYGNLVSNWEKGKYMPDAWHLCELADALECTVDEILGRK